MSLDAFKTQGSSPPKSLSGTRRYRLRLATWTVVREPGQRVLPRRLSLPEAVADVARQWFQASDDDREHLMVLMLDAQNGLRLIHEVSIVTQSASLVPSREVFGPAPAKALRRSSFFTTTLLATQPRAAKIWGVTRQLADAGKLLHINVHDQVIVGSDTCQYMSLARQSAL